MGNLVALPHAEEPEKSILSSMMQHEADAYLDRAAEEGLDAEDFYVPSHGDLYRVLSGLHEERRPIELVGLSQLLKDRGMLENMGGLHEISVLYNFAPTGCYFERHLAMVRAKALQRRAISVHTESIQRLYEALPEDAEAEVGRAASALSELLNRAESKSALSAREIVKASCAEIEARMEGRDNSTLELPWSPLNNLLNGGIGFGEITMVAARPSQGKTAFALNVMEHAFKQGVPGLFVSLESAETRLANRMLSAGSGVAVNRLGRGKPTREELDAVQRAAKALIAHPWWMKKLHHARHTDVSRVIRSSVRNHGVRFVVVDYMQLIKASSSSEQSDVRLRMDNALDAICPLAGQYGLALMLLVQLNREAEGLPGVKLANSMLKETSRFEQDADCVMMIGGAHDHESDGPDREPRVVHVSKNRDGETNFARLQFHGPTTTFLQHY